MTREELSEASEALEAAAAGAGGEAAEKLGEQARQLASLAEADRGPDHGRIARHQHAIRQLQEQVDDESAALIEEANDRLNAYRSTVEGV